VIVVRSLQATDQIRNPALSALVQQRINDLGGEAFDADSLGYFLVLEAGDTIEAIRTQVGFNILHNRFTGIRFDATGFTPSFEFIQEFASCYDMVFILSDDGYGVELFLPKEEGIDPDLIAMCKSYAFREDAP
jgi:hypothetical protein